MKISGYLFSNCSFSILGLALLVLTTLGCASQPKKGAKRDKIINHSVEAAQEAMDEGDLNEATKEYRKALLRAWAMDDAYESGTASYNLSVCFVSLGKSAESQDWLIDARVEFARARVSAGNTWLLEADIALQQERCEDASQYICLAANSAPPCVPYEGIADIGSEPCDNKCRKTCLTRIPCIGPKIRKKRELLDCQLTYQARLELAHARVAIQEMNLPEAKTHFCKASSLSAVVCDAALDADRHDVAALLFEQEGNYSQGGAHRDREIELLRSVAQYREIPVILEAAANSYLQIGRTDLAIERLTRAARVYTARKQYDRAWKLVRDAGELLQCSEDEASKIRLALTAKLIDEAISKTAKPQEEEK